VSYDTNEKAIEQPDSYECYTFALSGGYTEYRTTYFKDVVFDGHTFVATPGMTRSGFQATSDATPSEIKITMPADNPFAVLLADVTALQRLILTIQRVYADSYYDYVFKGELVGGVSLDEGKCEINFKDLLFILDREICRLRLQSVCNNTLFDSTCKVPSSSYKMTISVSVDNTGKILTSSDAAFKAMMDGYFTLGKVYFNGIYRLITKHDHDGSDGRLYITTPIWLLTSPSTVDIYAGCDKDPATCVGKFSNLVNFVGMPYIPLKDPSGAAITNQG